ncbi:hypothetical protein FLX56_11130 [Synechococcus moorigangaii CMS01]|nr:hypothetical protein [Synechococcus moorigangaii CMS01]
MATLRWFGLVAIGVAMSGCVSTHMQQFIGEDIREVVMADGPPVNVFDYVGGRRVFQFRWGGGQGYIPATATTQGISYQVGSTVFSSQQTVGSPAMAVSSDGCLISYITEWSEQSEGWVVEDIRYPQRLVC